MGAIEKAVVVAVLKARQKTIEVGDLLSAASECETAELDQLFKHARRQNKELGHTLVEIDAAQQAAIESGAGTLFEAARDEDDDEPETEDLDYPGGPTAAEALDHAADQSKRNIEAFFAAPPDGGEITNAYQEGVEAFHHADDSTNPYGDENDSQHEEWADGWADAEAFRNGHEAGLEAAVEYANPYDTDAADGEALHKQWERGHQAGLAELEARAAEPEEVHGDEWADLVLEVWRTPLKQYSATEVLIGRDEAADAVVAAALLSRDQVLYGHVWGLPALSLQVAHDDEVLSQLMAHLDEAQPVGQAGHATPELVIALLSEGVEAREWQTSVQTWTPEDLQEVARYLWCLLESKRRLKQGHEGVEIPARPELLADVAIPLAVELHHLDDARQRREARAALDAVGEEDAAEEVTAGAPVGSEDDPAADATDAPDGEG